MLLYGTSILGEKSCNQLGGHMFCLLFINKHGSSLQYINIKAHKNGRLE